MARTIQKHWTLDGRDQIERFWRAVRNVPARRRRSKRDEERFYLGLYLLALATHGIATYPVSLEEGESPDFMLSFCNSEPVGIEATKATTQQMQIGLTENEDEYERSRAIPKGEPEPVGRLMSFEGTAGDSVERNWVEQVREAIERKLKKLPKFRAAARYDLLIYDDTAYGPGDRVLALREIRKVIAELKRGNSRLGKVSIIMSLDVAYDVSGKCQILNFIELASDGEEDDLGERMEFSAQRAVTLAKGLPWLAVKRDDPTILYWQRDDGRIVKTMPDGRNLEVHVAENGEETVVGELHR